MFSSDTDILFALKADDKRALTSLYNNYWKQLFLASYNVLKDKEVCEEIIQDVFIDIWNKRKELQIKVSLQSYMYACVRYKVFAQLKKQTLLRIDLIDDVDKRLQYATPETRLMHKELEMQLNQVVNTLPEKCKQVYKLSRNEQLSHKEIAEKLDISIKTVENHITNALRVIRTSLGEILIFFIFTNL